MNDYKKLSKQYQNLASGLVFHLHGKMCKNFIVRLICKMFIGDSSFDNLKKALHIHTYLVQMKELTDTLERI